METVEVKGVTVTTRRNNGSPVHRTFAEPVRKALWTQMDTGQQLEADNSAMAPPPGDKQHVLCVLLSTTMHVFFAASGYVYDVPLLFPVETVFALAEGLLVVRSLQGEAGGKAAASTQPTLYTLTHPLDDLVPVGSLAEPGSGAAATAISWSPSVHLVGVAHEEAPLLLLYDSQQKKHTAWLYWWRGSAMAEAMADAPPPAQQTIQLVASTPVRSSKPSASSTLSPLTPLHPSSGFKLPGPRVSLGGNSSNAANTGANSLFLMRANSPNVTPSKRRRLSVMAGSAPLSPLRALALSPVVPSTAHGGVTAVVATPPPPATAAGRTAAKIRPTHSPLAPPMTPAAHGSFVSAGSPSSSSKLPTPERMTMDRSGVISPASSRLLLNSNSQVAHSSNDGPASRLAAAENQRPLLPDLVVKQIWEQSDTSPSPAIQSFCSFNSSNDLLFNLVLPAADGNDGNNRLVAMVLTGFDEQPVQPTLKFSFDLPNIRTAVPKCVTRAFEKSINDDSLIMNDIVVLRTDGSLVVLQDDKHFFNHVPSLQGI